MSSSFWLFAYGSRKTGECNHARIEGYVQQVQAACTAGQLFLRTDGYPALFLRENQQVRLGLAEADDDLRWAGFEIAAPAPNPPLVSGQLLELAPGAQALLELDLFEGYKPGQPSEYLRVLIPVFLEEGVSEDPPLRGDPGGVRKDERAVGAWVYACSEPRSDWQAIESWPHPDQPVPAPYTGGRA